MKLSPFILLALIALLINISHGALDIRFIDIIETLLSTHSSIEQRIVFDLRLPHAALAFLIGAMLALAGALMQSILRNPLADPYVLGTSGGASLAILMAFLFSIDQSWHVLIALVGASISTLLLLGIASGNSQATATPERLLLTGIILTTGWGALISFILTLSPPAQIPGMLFWLIGDLGYKTLDWWPFLILILLTSLALLAAPRLDLMLLGEHQAKLFGVDVNSMRWLLLSSAVVLTAVAVSLSGPIGFIGLVTPHLVRLILGSAHKALLPASVLLGGSLLTLADTFSRTFIAPESMPVGIFTAMLGVPLFFYLLKKTNAKD